MNVPVSAAGRPAVRRAAIGAVDQVLYSLTNFVVTAFVAHYSDTRQFGAYALLYACFLISSGIHRGVVCEPLIIRYSAARLETVRLAAIDSIGRSVFVGLSLASSFVIGTVAAPAAFRPLGFVFAAGLVIMFVQDCLRYAALACRRPAVALANDATVMVTQAVATITAATLDIATPTTLVVVWVLAGGVGAIVAAILLGVSTPSYRRRQHTPLARRLAATLGVDNAVVLTSQQATGFVLAAVASLSAAGALRAAQTAYAPLTTLLQGLQSAVIPELVRLRARSLAAMVKTLRTLTLTLSLLAISFTAIMAVLPESFGRLVLGASWGVADRLILLIGLAQIAGVPTGICQAAMRSFEDGGRILKARIIGVLCFAGTATVLASAYHIEGAGVGLAIGSSIQSAVWVFFFRASYRSQLHGSVQIRA